MMPSTAKWARGVALAACTAVVTSACDDGDPNSLLNGAGGPAGGSAGQGVPDQPPAQAGYAPAGLKRLTSIQYTNSIRDLFGDVALRTDLEADSRVYGFATVAAATKGVSERAVQQLEAAARDVANQVFSDDKKRQALVGCMPASSTDECTTTFISKFGRKAFRRPLTEAELTRFRDMTAAVAGRFGGNVWAGLEYATSAFVQSPYFVFRVELGQVAEPGQPRKIMGYEMASRLSYFLWSTTPDDTLLDAAQRGELDTRAGLEGHIGRMLESPRADEALRAYVDDYFALDRLKEFSRDVKVFPKVTNTLGASMREEVLKNYMDVVARGGDMLSLLDTRETFVNADLAALYGLPAPRNGDFERVTLDPNGSRGGLLGTAGILSVTSHSDSSSPTLRGKFVREDLLCQAIHPPPPGVPSALPAGPETENMTTREKLAAHLTSPSCAGCHKAMDPIGIGLENYDAIGDYRTTEKNKTINPNSELDGLPFAGPAELGKALTTMPAVSRCMVSKLYRYAIGHLAAPDQDVHIDSLTKDFDAGGRKLRALIAAVAASDAFRYGDEPLDVAGGEK